MIVERDDNPAEDRDILTFIVLHSSYQEHQVLNTKQLVYRDNTSACIQVRAEYQERHKGADLNLSFSFPIARASSKLTYSMPTTERRRRKSKCKLTQRQRSLK